VNAKAARRINGDTAAGQRARIACASCRSLASRAVASCARRWRKAASSRTVRIRPSLATKPAASSRARTTTLSSPDELPEVADEPPAEDPALVPAKLPACAEPAANAITMQRENRWLRFIGGRHFRKQRQG